MSPFSVRFLGFQRLALQDRKCFYWLRECEADHDSKGQPIVFIHGVGVGLAPYFIFVRRLINTFKRSGIHRDIILLEIPSISQHIDPPLYYSHIVAEELSEVLQKHGYKKALLVGHSFGTFVCASLVQQVPEIVESLVVIDAVSVFAHHGQGLKAVVYADYPVYGTIKDRIMYLITTGEINLQRLFRREMHWWSYQFFKEKIPDNVKTKIVIGHQDRMVPANVIVEHFLKPFQSCVKTEKVEIISFQDGEHGAFLIEPNYRDLIVESICELCAL